LVINIYDPISYQLTESVGRIQSERRQLEDEYEELRSKKDAIAQWEAQISEIIQW
jgi:serine/threonine-protein kinase MRCK